MSLEGTMYIKRCGLQHVVKCWKALRLLDAYFWKFWQFWTTSKIVLRIKYALLSEMCLFAELYNSMHVCSNLWRWYRNSSRIRHASSTRVTLWKGGWALKTSLSEFLSDALIIRSEGYNKRKDDNQQKTNQQV